MKKPNSLKRAKKFLATERVLPNTLAVDSTKPGYLAERMAQWRELQAAERVVHTARKEHDAHFARILRKEAA